MGMQLGIQFTYYWKGFFTCSNHIMDYKAITNYFETSYSVHQLRRCLYFLEKILLAATGKGGNFTLGEVDDLVTIDYCSGG